jgi:hypothetical protein
VRERNQRVWRAVLGQWWCDFGALVAGPSSERGGSGWAPDSGPVSVSSSSPCF